MSVFRLLTVVLLSLGLLVGGLVPAEAKNDKSKAKKKDPSAQTTPSAPVEEVAAPSPTSEAPKVKAPKARASKPPKPSKPSKEPVAAEPTPEPQPVTPPSAEPAVIEPSSPPVATPTPQPTPTKPAQRERRRDRSPVVVTAPVGPRQAPAAATDGGAAAAPGTPAVTPVADDRSGGEPPANDKDADTGGSPVTQTVREIVEVVPESVEMALGALLALSLILGGAYLFTTLRARHLKRQRHELLQEVGLLQTALLPPVPERIGALRTSVAYRPAEGPGAGGDFYDALPLGGNRAAFILGDVSGHGREALERTAFLRYTLRAYLEAGLEPRVALQVAGRVIDERLHGDFATVVLAVHDTQTASLSFACAGHPAPIVIGPSAFEPVLPGNSPPVGIGLRTGLRQTTIPLAPGSVACLFTDGLTEARTARGILGRPRLGDILADLGRDADATELLDRVAAEARLVTDDMAAVLLAPTAGVTAGGFRTEQLELSAVELRGNLARRFLEACGVDGEAAARTELEAAETARRFGGAILNVSYGTREPAVEVLPRNVESIEGASVRSIRAR